MSADSLSRIAMLAFATLEVACRTAVTSSPQHAPYVGLADGATRSRNVLAHAEFESQRAVSAYDVVKHYRPEFLRQRYAGVGTAAGGVASVYIDGNRQGGADVLRTIPAALVDEIRYLTPAAATMEFGRLGSGGIILVRLRR